MTQSLTLTRAQAEAVKPILRERLSVLRDLHAAQVLHLPPGCDAWADTADAIDNLSGLLRTLG